MKVLAAFGVAMILAGASTPAGSPHSAEAQAKLDSLLAGRVAGEAHKCVRADVVTNAIGIDDTTLLFRDGPRIWRTELRASLQCGEIGKRSFIRTESAVNRVCSGQNLEFSDGGIRGACVLGDFVPYTKP